MSSVRSGSPGATRECPHCRETVLESAAVCPACRHYLRVDSVVDSGVGGVMFDRIVRLLGREQARHPVEIEPGTFRV